MVSGHCAKGAAGVFAPVTRNSHIDDILADYLTRFRGQMVTAATPARPSLGAPAQLSEQSFDRQVFPSFL